MQSFSWQSCMSLYNSERSYLMKLVQVLVARLNRLRVASRVSRSLLEMALEFFHEVRDDVPRW